MPPEKKKTHTHKTVPSPPSVTMRSTFECRVSTSLSVEEGMVRRLWIHLENSKEQILPTFKPSDVLKTKQSLHTGVDLMH